VILRHTASSAPLRGQSPATYFTYREENRAFEDIGLIGRRLRGLRELPAFRLRLFNTRPLAAEAPHLCASRTTRTPGVA